MRVTKGHLVAPVACLSHHLPQRASFTMNCHALPRGHHPLTRAGDPLTTAERSVLIPARRSAPWLI